MPRDMLGLPFNKKCSREVKHSQFRMDSRSIVLYFRLKGITSRKIDDDLVTTLRDDAPVYSTMTLWLRQGRLPRLFEPGHDLAEDLQVNKTDQTILSASTIQPFASVRDIVRLT
jgi:hypothetical protein